MLLKNHSGFIYIYIINIAHAVLSKDLSLSLHPNLLKAVYSMIFSQT